MKVNLDLNYIINIGNFGIDANKNINNNIKDNLYLLNISNKDKNQGNNLNLNKKNNFEDIQRKIEEKIKNLKEKIRKEEEKKYRYIIKYDKLLRNYYLEIVDPQTKKIIKTIPPEFLLKVERNLKKFLMLLEKLENIKNLKQTSNFNPEEFDKNLLEIKNLTKELNLNSEDIQDLFSEYTSEFTV